MSISAIIALALGSALLTCTFFYVCWTVTRKIRFQVGVLRIRKRLVEEATKLNALDDAEYKHTVDSLETYYRHPELASLPVFAYLSVVLKDVNPTAPKTEREDLRPILDRATKEFVRQHLVTTFLECPTVIMLRAFLRLFPQWARQSLEKDTERSIQRSFDSVDCERRTAAMSRGRMQLAGGYAQSLL